MTIFDKNKFNGRLPGAIVALILLCDSPVVIGQCNPSGIGAEVVVSSGVGGYDELGNGSYTTPYTIKIKDGSGRVLSTLNGRTSDNRSVGFDSENQCYYYTKLQNINVNVPSNPGVDAALPSIPVLIWLEQFDWSGHYTSCSWNDFVVDQDKRSYTAIVAKEEDVQSCKAAVPPINNEPPGCNGSSPNPIAYRDGNKWLLERDIVLPDVVFTRKYNSNPNTATTSMGAHWSTGLESALYFSPRVDGVLPYSKFITALRGETGAHITFLYSDDKYTSTADRKEIIKLIRNVSGVIEGYHFYTADNSLERYDPDGKLISVTDPLGRITRFSYVNGDLLSVTSPSGRILIFGYLISPDMREGSAIEVPGKVIYNSSGDVAYVSSGKGGASGYSIMYIESPAMYPSVGELGYVANPTPQDALPVVRRSPNWLLRVTDPNGYVYGYAYDGRRNLLSVAYPDGTGKSYKYENTAFSHALTGVVDEKGELFSTYSYDGEGRAVYEQLAGGVGAYNFDYSLPNSTGVTDPLGNYRTYGFQDVFGSLKNVSQSQPEGSGCLAASSSKTYHPDGTIATETDFNGATTAYHYDVDTKLPVKVTSASGTAQSHDTLTQWHPYWILPIRIEEPTKVITNVYNGDAGALCAPTEALAPKNDGTMIPIAVLCTQTIQTKRDGMVDALAAPQVTRFTYDMAGRMLTSTDATGKITAYRYYTDTAFVGVAPNAVGHTIGDLQSVTNPAGHVTMYDLYDKAGHVLQTTDPNGVVTKWTYAPRGWVNTVTTTAPGQTPRITTYSHDAVGQLTGVTNPDKTSLTYRYDAAHRLIGISDSKGNSVSYTLDNAGNRIGERITDHNGALQRAINRSFDALSRVQEFQLQ
ncbi:MAG: DUF6531 domain-containing protein [Rhodoferax sp.]